MAQPPGSLYLACASLSPASAPRALLSPCLPLPERLLPPAQAHRRRRLSSRAAPLPLRPLLPRAPPGCASSSSVPAPSAPHRLPRLRHKAPPADPLPVTSPAQTRHRKLRLAPGIPSPPSPRAQAARAGPATQLPVTATSSTTPRFLHRPLGEPLPPLDSPCRRARGEPHDSSGHSLRPQNRRCLLQVRRPSNFAVALFLAGPLLLRVPIDESKPLPPPAAVLLLLLPPVLAVFATVLLLRVCRVAAQVRVSA
ncbi:hypothetical protein BRADI_1g38837v3 [Brachypodium distachyon]|uniref:Uncharacterized protein n=1 Tax=Brachypodium distachyon TaxID=15368 RepID=A0A0Q3L4N2_BRADI|nr:hypothetical protein BRADI_1g38837v3 [Brachypodium distachyon]